MRWQSRHAPDEMTPAQFKAKWAKFSGKESAAYQDHFSDLRRMLGVPTPILPGESLEKLHNSTTRIPTRKDAWHVAKKKTRPMPVASRLHVTRATVDLHGRRRNGSIPATENLPRCRRFCASPRGAFAIYSEIPRQLPRQISVHFGA
jgi:hypothetical protein